MASVERPENVTSLALVCTALMLGGCGGPRPVGTQSDARDSRGARPGGGAGPPARTTDVSSRATGQSYEEGMRAACSAIGHASGGDPRPLVIALDRAVVNLQARAVVFRVHDPVEQREDFLRDGAARAGLRDCLPAARSGAPGRVDGRARELVRGAPASAATDTVARTVRDAVRVYCDDTLLMDVGTGAGADDPSVRHAAYVDAHLDNDEVRRRINALRGGSAHPQRVFAALVARGGLAECHGESIEGIAELEPQPDPSEIALDGVTGGDDLMCVLRRPGSVACVGSPWLRERLRGRTAWVTTDEPVVVPGLDDVVQVTAGGGEGRNRCALRRNGDLLCWSTRTAPGGPNLTVPTLVRRDVVSVDSRDGQVCVVSSSREVSCWGSNQCGEAGARRRADRVGATVVPIRRAVQVAVGELFSCARTEEGAVECWGDRPGLHQHDTCAFSPRPARVLGISAAIGLVAGEDHACALVEGGSVWCWGANRYGQLGDGSGVERSDVAVRAAVDAVREIDAADTDTCALHDDGTVTCWGYGFVPWRFTDAPERLQPQGVPEHQFFGRLMPTRVPNVEHATDITVGDSFACALRRDHRVTCFGRNFHRGNRPSWEESPLVFEDAPPILLSREP